MEYIERTHIVPCAELGRLRHLHSDLAKLNSYIANLEKRIAQWREVTNSMDIAARLTDMVITEIDEPRDETDSSVKHIIAELRECRDARDQILSQLNGSEHKINCELIRGIHLICA